MESSITFKQMRLKLLCRYLQDITIACGVGDSCIDIIKKGVLERQIIKTIQFNYANEESLIVAQITISIDWDKFDLIVSTDNTKTVIDITNQSCIDQWISDITKWHDNLIQHCRYSRIRVSYGYIDNISLNDKKNSEVSSYLGFAAIRSSPDEIQEQIHELHEYTNMARELENRLEHILNTFNTLWTSAEVDNLIVQITDLKKTTVSKLILVDKLTKNLEITLKQYQDATSQLFKSLLSLESEGKK